MSQQPRARHGGLLRWQPVVVDDPPAVVHLVAEPTEQPPVSPTELAQARQRAARARWQAQREERLAEHNRTKALAAEREAMLAMTPQQWRRHQADQRAQQRLLSKYPPGSTIRTKEPE